MTDTILPDLSSIKSTSKNKSKTRSRFRPRPAAPEAEPTLEAAAAFAPPAPVEFAPPAPAALPVEFAPPAPAADYAPPADAAPAYAPPAFAPPEYMPPTGPGPVAEPGGPGPGPGPRRLPSLQPPSRRVLALVAVVALLVVAGGGYELTKSHTSTPTLPVKTAVPPPTGPVTPSSTLIQVMANALAEKSVHVVVVNTSPKHANSVSRQSDAITTGVQRISMGSGRVVIRVVGPTTYFTANRKGFIKYFGLTPAQATQVRGQWVPLVQGEPGYLSVSDSVTLSSMLQELALSGPLKRLPERTKDGQHVFGISGRATGDGMAAHTRATLWISEGAHGLPVEFDAKSNVKGKKLTTVGRLSDWGLPVDITMPSPIVGSGATSGGIPS